MPFLIAIKSELRSFYCDLESAVLRKKEAGSRASVLPVTYSALLVGTSAQTGVERWRDCPLPPSPSGSENPPLKLTAAPKKSGTQGTSSRDSCSFSVPRDTALCLVGPFLKVSLQVGQGKSASLCSTPSARAKVIAGKRNYSYCLPDHQALLILYSLWPPDGMLDFRSHPWECRLCTRQYATCLTQSILFHSHGDPHRRFNPHFTDEGMGHRNIQRLARAFGPTA